MGPHALSMIRLNYWRPRSADKNARIYVSRRDYNSTSTAVWLEQKTLDASGPDWRVVVALADKEVARRHDEVVAAITQETCAQLNSYLAKRGQRKADRLDWADWVAIARRNSP